MNEQATPLGVDERAALPDSGLLVIGGRQRSAQSMRELGDGWYGYAEGVIAAVDDRGARVEHRYVSPLSVRGPDDAVLFKCATRVGDLLYATTETEVLVYRLPDFDVVHHISHPWFNDVHHVLPTSDDTVLVAVSGLEMVVEMSLDGEIVRQHCLAGDDPWVSRSSTDDYRFGVDLKPHQVHPNHLFQLGDEPWATRFESRDAVSLTDSHRRIDIGRQRVHDGHVHDDRVWFTTVDGAVAIADAQSLEVTEVHDLTGGRDDAVLGWCRGLFVNRDHVWVGFSRIRQTRFRSRLSWVRHGLHASLPTRVECWSRDDWSLEAVIDLEPIGVNAVFTIVDGVRP